MKLSVKTLKTLRLFFAICTILAGCSVIFMLVYAHYHPEKNISTQLFAGLPIILMFFTFWFSQEYKKKNALASKGG